MGAEQRFVRPHLCRLCEFPVVDGGVLMDPLGLAKVSRWLEQNTGHGLSISADEEEKSAWICQFCLWDARFCQDMSGDGENYEDLRWWSTKPDPIYETHYKEDHLRACYVRMPFDARTIKSESEDESSTPSTSEHSTKGDSVESVAKEKKLSFECIYCLKRYRQSCNLAVHMRMSHSLVAIRCLHKRCLTYFQTQEKLSEHLISVHKSVAGSTVICLYCKKIVYSWQALCAHINHFHKDVKIKCQFPGCFTFFETENEKHLHIQEMHKARNLDCLYCKRTFIKVVYLRQHVKKWHKSIAIQCGIYYCGKYFVSQEELKIHFEAVHAGREKEFIYRCDLCDFKAGFKIDLAEHIFKKHSLSVHKCTFPGCRKEFKSKKAMKCHLKKHEKKKQPCPHCHELYRSAQRHLSSRFCEHCNLEFDCAGLETQHKTQCNSIIECRLCKSRFKKKSTLRFHLIINHRPRIVLWKGLKFKSLGFTCEPCLKHFKSKKALSVHKKIIHPLTTKPALNCDLCQKQFFCKFKLRRHLADVHLFADKTWTCKMCLKIFFDRTSLTHHWNNVHYAKNLVECEQCGKIMAKDSLKRHNLIYH